MTITLNISDEAAAALRQAWGNDLDRAAMEAMAIEGYRSGKLSLAEVGMLLGFDNRWETEEWLGNRGVNWNYSLQDLENDRRTLDHFFGDAAR